LANQPLAVDSFICSYRREQSGTHFGRREIFCFLQCRRAGAFTVSDDRGLPRLFKEVGFFGHELARTQPTQSVIDSSRYSRARSTLIPQTGDALRDLISMDWAFDFDDLGDDLGKLLDRKLMDGAWRNLERRFDVPASTRAPRSDADWGLSDHFGRGQPGS